MTARATSSVTITPINDSPTFAFAGNVSGAAVSYNEGDATISLSGITVDDVDSNDDLSLTISITAANWPDDSNAPDGSVYSYDVTDTYGGTIASSSVSWGATSNNQWVYSAVADSVLTAELGSLVFTSTADVIRASEVPDLTDLDLTLTVNLSLVDSGDPGGANSGAVTVTDTITLTPTVNEDAPEAVLDATIMTPALW